MRRSLRLPAFLLAALAAGAALAANGAKPVAAGAQAAGRGSADVAVAEDSTSVFTNPAGLAWKPGFLEDAVPVSRRRLDFGLVPSFGSLGWRNKYDDAERSGSLGVLPILAASFDQTSARESDEPLRTESFETEGGGLRVVRRPSSPAAPGRSWGWGIGLGIPLAPPPDAVGGISISSRLHPEGKEDKKEALAFAVGAGLGVEIIPGLRLGAGLQYHMLQVDVLEIALRKRKLSTPNGGVIDLYEPGGSGSVLVPDVPLRQLLSQRGGGEESHFGFDVRASDLEGRELGGNLGLLWTPTEAWSFGLSWTPKVDFGGLKGELLLNAEAGVTDAVQDQTVYDAMTVIAILSSPNFTPPPNQTAEQTLMNMLFPRGGREGLKSLYDLEVDGLAIPQTISAGLAWRAAPRWRLSYELRWIEWSQSHKEWSVKLTKGSNFDLNTYLGGDYVNIELGHHWKDQLVHGLGCEWRFQPGRVLRFGWNFGRSPIPRESISPTASAIHEHHLTLGLGASISERWSADLGLVHAFEASKTSGKNQRYLDLDYTTVSTSQTDLYIGMTYRF